MPFFHPVFRYLIALLCVWLPLQAGAWQLRGTVRDEAGEALPYVSVYLENTTYGVVTNLKGEFFLELEPGAYTLVFQSVGYATQKVPVTMKAAAQELEIVMRDVSVEMDTVTITAGRRDPAYAIIQQVIDHKKDYIHQYDAWRANTYIKVSLESDSEKTPKDSLEQVVADSLARVQAAEDSLALASGDSSSIKKAERERNGWNKPGTTARKKLNFVESWSEVWFRSPNDYKSIVKAYKDLTDKTPSNGGVSISIEGSDGGVSRSTLSNPYLFYLSVSDADFNFYKNLIDIPALGEQPFVSPVSSSAFVYYKFKLEETFQENGRIIHRIRVIPREWEGPMFEGVIFVVDGEWAIKAVDLQIKPTSLHFFKYFQVVQENEKTPDNQYWVHKRQEFFYNTREGKTRYYGNTICLQSDYVINPEIPKNFFHNELIRIEDSAYTRDTAWWNAVRPVTLKAAERTFIREQDSIYAYLNSPAYIDSVDSVYNKVKLLDILVNGIGHRNRVKGLEWFLNPLVSWVNPVGVGGIRFIPGGNISKKFDRATKLDLAGNINYGPLNNDLRGDLTLGFTYNPKRFSRAYIRYGNDFKMLNSFNSITATFSRGNYVQKEHYGVGHEFEVWNGFFLDNEIEYADYKSLEDLKIEKWSEWLFGNMNQVAEFDPYSEFLIYTRVRLRFAQKYYMAPREKLIVGTKYPEVNIRYKKAIPGIGNSTVDYDFVQVDVQDDFQLGNFGDSRWRVYAGAYLRGPVIKISDYKYFRGSDSWYFSDPLRSFQLLDTTLSTTKPFVEAHYLHDFHHSIFNKVPLLKRTKLEAVAGGGFMLLDEVNFTHAELWAGIGYPIRIKQTIFKLGAYYVMSANNTDLFSGRFKFGISFYDSFTQKWFY